MARVVVAGSFNVDHVWTLDALPAPGETRAGRYASGPGGKGFNQAVAAARAGASTTFLCALGDDAGAHWARELAAADGIDLRAEPSDAPTGTAGICVDADGRNMIAIGAGANAALSAGFLARERDVFGDARVVLAQLESPMDAIAEALRLARAHGALALLNPAPANAATTKDLLAASTVLTPNESELSALLQRHLDRALTADAVAASTDDALHAACRALLPHGTVVVTLGASGCFVSHPDDARRGDDAVSYRVAAEPARVVDTTGAGDAFNGALAAALAMQPQRAFAEHVRFAGRYAALSTERPGAALSMPARAEVEARFG
ncbi:MAG TPA: ribokinase [Xanthomonadaceae bacterium]|nr:ribokinase [Xanthomonadaceae bacterium]